MIRRILVPMDPSEYSKSALLYAANIAQKQQSEIEGMTVIDIPDIEDVVTTFLPLPQGTEKRIAHENEMINDARQKSGKLLHEFGTFCDEHRIFCTRRQYEGKPENVILKESKFFDLVIIGMRTYFHFETDYKAGHSLEKLLNHTITPIMAVPKKFRQVKKVLIAYDGSMPAVRAMQRFVHMAVNSEFEITLLMQAENEENAMHEMNNAEDYIKRYRDIPIKKVWTRNNLITVVDKEFISKSDIVVCGFHSNNILGKFKLGSFPKYLIERNDTAAFICQ
ncbi:MAG: universal stress protein [Bacteroidales bacterium]|nr:universal stress protein [Bacteroidales bacterium]